MAGPLTFCERAAEKCPEHAALFERLSDLYNRKLWHQLLLHVEKAIKDGVFGDDLLVRLYHDFIAHFGFKINLLAFAKLAVEASKAYTEPAQGLSFLEVEMAKMQGPECSHLDVREPVLYMKMHLSQFKLNLGDVQESKKLFEEGLEELDRMRDVDPVVSASVHWVRSLYHKYMKDFAEFYRSALMYLCFVSSDELSEDFKKPLAVDISLAALLGEGVYNFGELLLHPIVNSIKDSSYQWLYELLECFHAGDMHLYDELCGRHTAALNAQPALVENARRLREKITILSLMELITSTPAEERKIALADIGTRTKLDTDGVEFLLMKTMSLGLIKGVIDEVDSFVQVSWVQPRVMTVPQISALGDRLQGWIDKVDRAAQLLEDRGVTLEAA